MDQYFSKKDFINKAITIYERVQGQPNKVVASIEYGDGITKMKERDAENFVAEVLKTLKEHKSN